MTENFDNIEDCIDYVNKTYWGGENSVTGFENSSLLWSHTDGIREQYRISIATCVELF